MKKHLLFLILLAFVSALATQANNAIFSANGKNTDYAYASTSSTKSDTFSIPWREDFESINKEDELPYGTTRTYNRTTSKNIRTFLTPNASENKTQKARRGNNYLAFMASLTCDEWIFTPGIFLRAGTEYTFSFWYDVLASGWGLTAKVGLSPTAEAMNINIADSLRGGTVTGGYKKCEGSFIAPKDAIYYFGIHAINKGNKAFLAIDDLELSTTPPACSAVSVFFKTNTTSTIDVYRTYTPLGKKMILNYQKDSTHGGFVDVTNQEYNKLSGLVGGSKYNIKLGVVCSTADTLWSATIAPSTLTPNTPQIPTDPGGAFPINLNFDEGNSVWRFMNDSLDITIRNPNKWYIDSVGKIIPGRTVAYVSGDGGETNTYIDTVESISRLYTYNFLIPEAEEFLFSFSWRAYGKNFGTAQKDFLRVLIADTILSVRNTNISSLGGTNVFGTGVDLNLDSNMTTKTAILAGTYSNTLKKIIFVWRNDKLTPRGVSPAAAIDSIMLKPITCAAPKDLIVKKVASNSILLACKAVLGSNASFEIAYKEQGGPEDSWRIKSGFLKIDSLLLNGLNPNTNYDIKIRKRYGIDSSFWTPVIQKKTINPVLQPGFNEGFDNFDTQRCIVINETQANKWVVGSSAEGASGKAIYISKDNGASSHYSITDTSIVHFYYDLDFAQAEIFRLSFDWKGVGQLTDFLRISLIDIDVIPEAGKILPINNRIFGKDFYNRRTWAHEEMLFDKSYTGKQKRVVFTWKNILSAEDFQPAIAIDNIRFDAMNCTVPEYFMAVGSDQSSIALMAKKPELGNTLIVNYKKAGPFEEWFTQTVPQSVFFNDDKFKLTQLDPNTAYEVKIRQLCSTDTSLFTPVVTARTIQVPAAMPLFENFENEATHSKWLIQSEGQSNQWMVGNAVANGGTKSLYITNENKTDNAYNPSKRTVVHFYREIKFDEAKEYEFSFDWKGGNANSFMSVYIADINQTIQPGILDSRGTIMDGVRYSGSAEWKKENISITKSDQLSNSTRSLVFTWVCDGTGGEQAPFAIDNIELRAIKCSSPIELKYVSFPESNISDKVEIQFSDVDNINKFLISCTNSGDNSVLFVHADTARPIVTGLKYNTDYELKVLTFCPKGDSSLWSDAIKFRTPQKIDSLPFTENFEDPNNVKLWTSVNGESANRWFFGSAIYAPGGGNQAAYVDSLDGNTNGCSNIKSIVHLYRDIDFPASDVDFMLNFQWREKSFARRDGANLTYLNVHVIDIDAVPTPGADIQTYIHRSANIYSYNENIPWNNETLILPCNKLAGKKKRLVFCWRNEGAAAIAPVAIDNINLVAPKCNVPENVKYTMLSPTSVQLNWTCKYTDSNKFHIEFENRPELNKYATDTSAILNLTRNTPYSVSITNKCGGEYNIPVKKSFRTNQQVPALPFYEKFDSQESINDWTFVNGDNENKWIAGNIDLSAENTDIKTAAFVSSDGQNNVYVSTDAITVHMYRDIYFDNTDKLAISFDWRAMGRSSNDYMRVYIVDSTIIPTYNNEFATSALIYDIAAPGPSMYFLSQPTWKTEYFTVKGTKNTKKRLVFSWHNSASNPQQPPAAFSNLYVQAIDCATPANLTIKNYLEDNSIIFTWQNVDTSYMLRYKPVGGGTKWDSVFVSKRNFDTLKFASNINNVPYEVQVQSKCGKRSAWSPAYYFNTQQELGEVPFFEDFSDIDKRTQWNIVNGAQINAWYIDTAVYAKGNGNYAAYISDSNGRSNTYFIKDLESNVVHLYRDIEVLNGQKEVQLLLDWKGYGEVSLDYMQIYRIDRDSIPKVGKLLPTASLLTSKKFGLYKHDWKKEYIVVPASTFKVGRNRLVFTWTNNTSGGEQSPIAIDNIAVNMSTCLSPTNIASTAIGQDSAVLKWNTRKETFQHFNLRYRKIEQGNDNEAWEEEPMAADSNYVLRNLTANRLYEVQIQTKCSSDTSVWIPYTVQTQQVPVELPFMENFESDTVRNAWIFCNGEQENAWFTGTAAGGNNSAKSAYISNEGGRTNIYAEKTAATVYAHMYKDITFPPAAEYQIAFDWKSVGNSEDYLRAFLIDLKTPVTAGTYIPSKAGICDPLFGSAGWAGFGALLPDTLSGKTMRLVFTWINGEKIPNQTPAAVDNLLIRALDCVTPKGLKVVDYPDLHSAVLEWESPGDTFTLQYGKVADPQSSWIELGVRDTRNVKTITLQGLDSNTLYQLKVKNSCAERTIFCSPVTIRTLNTPITKFPYTETFEEDSQTKDKWVTANGNHTNAWYIGKGVAAKGGEQSMYISSTGGSTYTYDKPKSLTHFYRDITFPENGIVEMSFDWRCKGTGSADYMQFTMTDVFNDPASENLPTGSYTGKYYANATEWKTSTILFQDTTLRGKRKRLLFTWINKNGVAYAPPAAVDNITFMLYNCNNVQNIQTEVQTDKQVALSWQGASDATSYTISYKPVEGGNWIDKEVMQAEGILDELQPNTYYSFKVTLNCEAGSGKPLYDTVLMACSVPFVENFDTIPNLNWSRYSVLLPIKDSVILSTTSINWVQGYFVNAANASKAAKIPTNSAKNDWLITPQIYLAPGTKTELEFNLGLTFLNQPGTAPDRTSMNDRFVVLVSKNDNKWYAKDAILIWDNKIYNREYDEISYTREGDKIKVSLENYSGLVRLAFYAEATGPSGSYSFNDLFLDNVAVRPAVCEKVQDVHISRIGLDSATVAWLAPKEQYNWQVQCTKFDGTPVDEKQLLEEQCVTINALEMNTEYNVSVRSICSETDTSTWFTKKFTTKSTCVGIPEGIDITQTDSNATITWETQLTHEKWQLHYGLATQTREQMPSVITSTPTYTMSGLTQLTDYAFYIRAICNTNDTGNWTEKQSYKTLRTPCYPISNLAVKGIKVSAATVTWDATDAQSQWEIRYGLSGTSLNTMGTTFVTTKIKPLTTLLQNTTYDCYVRGICGVGDTSAWSTKAVYTTLECTTVENLHFAKNNEGKTILNWTAGIGHTSWIVNITEKSTSTTVGTQTVNDTTFTIDYTTLKLDTKKDYNLSVKANCNNNASQYWSDPIALTSVGILSVDANQNIKINLSPNPAKDIAKLNIEGATGLVTVQIYTLKGELINTANLYCEEGKVKEMKITGLAQGSYIIRLLNEKWVTTEKLIVN